MAHSLSPRMHNAAFAAAGLNWVYLAFRVTPAALPVALRGLAALGLIGVNVTIPHKEAVLGLLDEVHPSAARAGAVNVVRCEGRRLSGFNTDGAGVVDALARDGGAHLAGSRCLVLGAGGGARAAVLALAEAGAARITVLNRTAARAEALAAHVASLVRDCAVGAGPLDAVTVGKAVEDADVVVQATSATMSAAMGGAGGRAAWMEPLRAGLRGGMRVLDMVYTPRWTELLTAAREAGATPVSGLSMLVYQGARAFELWTGRAPPLEVMQEAVHAAIPDRG